jgi:hypothetical protein
MPRKSLPFASWPPLATPVAESPVPPKYPRPKILLLDTPAPVLPTLRDAGFNAVNGTMGMPYAVKKGGGFQQLCGKFSAPNYTEQEVVVVDLAYDQVAEGPSSGPERPASEVDLWGKCDKGVLDPRVRSAVNLSGSFDRVLNGGGVFVVFANRKLGIETVTARENRFQELCDSEAFPYDAWDLLTELRQIEVKSDHGREIRPAPEKSPLGSLLNRHLDGAHFTCTLKQSLPIGPPWQPLALNKYGDAVALARFGPGNGWVILLPQLADKARFLLELLTTVLPEIAPHLFSAIEQGRWTTRPEYEVPKILDLKAQQVAIKERAKLEVGELEKAIQAERQAQQWMHDLLTGTDDCLVDGVKLALRCLGFAQIVDVDEQRDGEGKSRREDLQIDDARPTLIVDIKGIGGCPGDDDALQADKHATIRMREWNRIDIVGLSIINHQRHLPPLDRENAMPFRKELLDAAEEYKLGLMTSWDLYRLIRNSKKHGWRPDDVKPVFYKKGRIDPVPEHYQLLGKVAKVWTGKFGIVMEAGTLSIGETISVEFPIEFEEVKVESIMVDKVPVESCKAGDQVGLLWPTDKPKLREGLRVFRCASRD